MNPIPFVIRDFKIICVLMIGLIQASTVYAKDNECWADFFEGTQYQGKHFLLEGANRFKNLSTLNGENWDSRISSIKTGPKTTITVYEHYNFKLKPTDKPLPPDLMRSWGLTEKDIKEDSELIFNANAMIHDLSDFNFRQKIKSLKVECIQ